MNEMKTQEMTTQTELGKTTASPRKGAVDGVRNELSVFLRVKRGHEKQIRAVLSSLSGEAVDLAREAVVNVGTLHDARQVLFDNDTRLMIGTSFDGNWDVYINDFARTSILDLWAKFLVHCEGYPDQDAAPFSLFETKEFLTTHQVTAAAYIGRYPDATVKDILKALRVQAVFQELLDEASSG
jgi:hypothetical protein